MKKFDFWSFLFYNPFIAKKKEGELWGKQKKTNSTNWEALFNNAYELFLTQGIEKTTINDIVKKAGVAKGTFYLYFTDKYHIRDQLIAKTADKLFRDAYKAMEKENIPSLEDRIIFIVDYVLDCMRKNKPMLRFISKNLSWGIFRHAITKSLPGEDISTYNIYKNCFLIIQTAVLGPQKPCCF